MADISTACILSGTSLTYLQHTVSVVYFRAGYTPNDYPSPVEWIGRALIESSDAVKCPNVGYHLAGTKAIQAALCKPNILERYLSIDEAALVKKCFASQYSLGDEEVRVLARDAIQQAKADGSRWVLKPQREGGGNNYYNANLSVFLQEHEGKPELSGMPCPHSALKALTDAMWVWVLTGYVLMQRIFPRQAQTLFYRQGKGLLSPSISELGIYGAYLGTPSSVVLNEYSGYLLRTKAEGVDEGGVATGYSVLNSVALLDP